MEDYLMTAQSKTKKLTLLAMLCALSYLAVALIRIPVVLFLKYEPKDVIVTLGGLLFGPLASLSISVVVSTIEAITISETGLIGLLMNILSTCSFACTATYIYQKKHTMQGAVIGLVTGGGVMVVVMLLWNYLITPLYMGYPREAVAAMLLPAFLPFNLLKGAINTTLTLLLYKPIITALRKAHILDAAPGQQKAKVNTGLILVCVLVLATCILFTLSLNGTI